jgi:tetratricopeptide (TPR) repeat protein
MKVRVKVLIVSGSDLKFEREKIALVLSEIGKSFPGFKIDIVTLETDLPSGSYPKNTIREETSSLIEQCEIVVIPVYSRFGYFREEIFRRALAGNKKILLYFKTGFSPRNIRDMNEYSKVLKFKDEIEKENRVLYKEYVTVEDFEKIFSADFFLYISHPIVNSLEKIVESTKRGLEDLSGLSKEERFILSNISALPPQPVDIADLKDWLSLEKSDLINGMVGKGWLKRIGNKLEMPFVIGEMVRKEEPPTVEKCRDLIASLSTKLYMEPGDNPIDKKEFLEYGESVVKYMDGDDLKLATLMNNMSMIYQNLGQLNRALQLQERATKIYEKTLLKNHPTLATSYNNLATIFKAIGQPEFALEFQEKALKILESGLDKNNPSISISYSNISSIYQDMGKLEEALTFEKKALEILEAMPDKNNPDLANSYHNLATIYQKMGKLEEALALEEKALKTREASLEQNHSGLAESYHHIGRIFFSLGRFEESLDYQKKAAGIIEKIFPGIHPLAADSYVDLALVLQALGRLDEALDYGKKGMEILQKLYPEGHPRLEQLSEFVNLIRTAMSNNTVS